MTVLEMPSRGPSAETFEIQRVDFLSPEAGGRMGGVSAGFPLWSAGWTFSQGTESYDEWTAFVDSLDGVQGVFFGRDYSRPYPKAHPGGFAGLTRAGAGTPFDGTATSWSVDGTRRLLTLGGLPAGLVLSRRDYCGFGWTTAGQPRRALVRTVGPAVANGAGVLTVAVRPALPGLVPVGAVADLARPACLMKLVPSGTKKTDRDRRGWAADRLAAVQELLD